MSVTPQPGPSWVERRLSLEARDPSSQEWQLVADEPLVGDRDMWGSLFGAANDAHFRTLLGE